MELQYEADAPPTPPDDFLKHSDIVQVLNACLMAKKMGGGGSFTLIHKVTKAKILIACEADFLKDVNERVSRRGHYHHNEENKRITYWELGGEDIYVIAEWDEDRGLWNEVGGN
jgi:hypothetical protein